MDKNALYTPILYNNLIIGKEKNHKKTG